MIRNSIFILSAFSIAPALHAAPASTPSDWVQVPNLDGDFCVDRASIQRGESVTFAWKRCDAGAEETEQDKLDCSQDRSKDIVMYYRTDETEDWKSDTFHLEEPGAVIAAYVCGLAANAS